MVMVINSICLDFGMQLLKDTVKQHVNHISGTWGDAEHEFGEICRKTIRSYILFYF